VPCIWSNDQGQIEKDLFTFAIGDLMKVPVLGWFTDRLTL
jgi:hypothetical protein